MGRSPAYLRPLILVGLVVIVSGCGGSQDWHAKTFPVSGSITINGQPPENLILLFNSLSGPIDTRESVPYAIVDGEGNFSGATYEDNDGLPAGEFAITIRWPTTLDTMNAPDRLKEQFSSVDNAVATFTVAPGVNTVPPIHLTQVKVMK